MDGGESEAQKEVQHCATEVVMCGYVALHVTDRSNIDVSLL